MQHQRNLILKRPRDQKTNNQISTNKNFTAKIEYLNLKKNNVKMQSDKILTTKVFFSQQYSRWKVFLMRLGNKSTKRTNSEAKLKNSSSFLHQEISKNQTTLAFN